MAERIVPWLSFPAFRLYTVMWVYTAGSAEDNSYAGKQIPDMPNITTFFENNTR